MLRILQQHFRRVYNAPPAPFAMETIPYQKGRFAIVGDLQAISRLEFWRRSNIQERVQIIQRIAMEAPDFLAIVGDLVFCGSSAAAWTAFDTLTMPLSEARVPVLPLLGNHDYWVRRRVALEHFFARFPHLGERHWFSVTYGPLGVIFLDSNIAWLTAAQWHEQFVWYTNELQRFERLADIRGILVLLHHPPYTNNPSIAQNRAVQNTFVPPFMQAHKTLVMVAGHVHSYERFERANKTFLVSGGGGPRIKLATGRRRRHLDDCFAGPPVRGFHFLMLTPSASRLEIEMQGLHQDLGVFETLDHLSLPWPEEPMKDLL